MMNSASNDKCLVPCVAVTNMCPHPTAIMLLKMGPVSGLPFSVTSLVACVLTSLA